jgi:hypothetical protein
MRFVEGDSAPALRNLPHRVDSYSEAGSFAKQVRRARTGRDLFLPLLLAAILCVMAEGWVVNPVPRTTCTR